MILSTQLQRKLLLFALVALPIFSAVVAAAVEPLFIFPTNSLALENSGHAVIHVRGLNPNREPAELHFWTTAGTATEHLDFLPISGVLLCSSGLFSAELLIPVVDDCLSEPSEAFSLTLGTIPGTPLDSFSTIPVTIMDNDQPGMIAASLKPPSLIPDPTVMLVQPDGRILVGGAEH